MRLILFFFSFLSFFYVTHNQPNVSPPESLELCVHAVVLSAFPCWPLWTLDVALIYRSGICFFNPVIIRECERHTDAPSDLFKNVILMQLYEPFLVFQSFFPFFLKEKNHFSTYMHLKTHSCDFTVSLGRELICYVITVSLELLLTLSIILILISLSLLRVQ